MGKFSVCFYSFCFALKRLFFLQSHARIIIYSFLHIKLSSKIYHLTARASERENNDVGSDDARNAEKADRGERCVEFDRE